MLKFVSRERETPMKRNSGERRRDFDEIYARFADDHASTQASRCSQCGVPFCSDHCPLGNDIPDWLKAVAEGRLEDAYALSSATNNMPEVCGRICPQDRLCEGSCVIEQSGHGTVTIGSVEQYITETAWDKGWIKPVKPAEERPQSVGVIGAGPAGLAAAEELRKEGFQVKVYDRYDRTGGLLVYGIPNFKLEKHVVSRRTEHLEKSGVQFIRNFEVGRDATLAELRADHDAILIATGVYKARDLVCPGSGNNGVIAALDYLTASNRKGLGDDVAAFNTGDLDASGKSVVVIGGGDTAMDCVRTAVRQSATSVICLYRRDRKNMPGSLREVANAEEEGVIFEWLAAPKGVKGDAAKANGIRVSKMELGEPDESGRRAPVEIDGAEFDIDADMVIKALGFEAEDLPALFNEPDLKVTPRGTLRVDGATLETNIPGVYAAGDIVRGASLVVWAIVDGRKAAAAITMQLNSANITPIAAE
ncbi:NAD(P)-dependent oxidoreductase [Hyphococcus flavus]|uniref:NAD(P)-dependent oxidoreductase n=2 Tax=Hyphococcus flavus TaxID=1866326 RepID=A0AAE9ZDV0_9PROT|nr:NAD(P)-dependent oxidoreductase [Hyphococcus flavus]WDI30843.1 NAD(P)-dependent oxidoreductase [Hyphococcus flavus]